jgi:hypothetical protein
MGIATLVQHPQHDAELLQSSILIRHGNKDSNLIHHLLSVQVISEPGCHFALAANFHFFFIWKKISTYAKDFCNKQKAIIHQISKGKKLNRHMLEGSFSAVPGGHTEKLCREFFVDPSHWWDHRPEKVTEHHSCQSSHVNGAIPVVGVNLVALCRLLQSCPGLNLAEVLFRSFALVG